MKFFLLFSKTKSEIQKLINTKFQNSLYFRSLDIQSKISHTKTYEFDHYFGNKNIFC